MDAVTRVSQQAIMASSPASVTRVSQQAIMASSPASVTRVSRQLIVSMGSGQCITGTFVGVFSGGTGNIGGGTL
jgi:hypothetical protein